MGVCVNKKSIDIVRTNNNINNNNIIKNNELIMKIK